MAGRVAHAYLFTGARGVGKTSVARILAKTLNCEKELPARPCNVCSNCREITQGNSVDVLEVDGASNRGIDSIRELRETVRYRPAKSRSRIYIIDEVHMLTTEAFNALLKTLEEPPEHVVFLFATTEPHKIPSTILSRCQRFDFRRIATSLIVDHLKRIASDSVGSESEISTPLLYAIAKEADGSMRDAQSLLEQVLAFSGAGLSDAELLDVLGVVDRSSVLLAGKAVVEGDAPTCLQVVDRIHARGIDCRRFCQHLCDHFRNLLFIKICEDDADLRMEIPDEEREMLRSEAEKITPESIHLIFQLLLKGEEDIRRATMPKIALEMLLVRLATLPSLQSVDRILQDLSLLEKRFSQGGPLVASERVPPLTGGKRREETYHPGPSFPSPGVGERDVEGPENAVPKKDRQSITPDEGGALNRVAPLEPIASSGAGSPPFSGAENSSWNKMPDGTRGCLTEEVPSRWPEFLQWSQERCPVLSAKLHQSDVRDMGAGTLQVNVLEIFEAPMKDPQNLQRLRGAIRDYFGRDFQVKVGAKAAGHPSVEGGRRSSPSKTQKKVGVMEHPVVQQAMEILGAELIEIKPAKSSERREKKGGRIPGEGAA